MDKRDLRSVLRLFSEIASSVNEDEGAHAPDREGTAPGGEEHLPSLDRDASERSSTAR